MHRERCGNRWNALGLSIAYFSRNLDLGGWEILFEVALGGEDYCLFVYGVKDFGIRG